MTSSSVSLTPAIIADPADVTAFWLNSLLEAHGHDVSIRSIHREAVGTGQMAHNERYRFTFDGDPGDAPESVVIKFPSPNEQSRAAGAAGAYSKEVHFYTELASRLSVSVPECFYGAVSDDMATFTLVLADLAPARQGDQIDGATDDQILLAVENLAGLHAPLWDSPALHDIDWLVASEAQLSDYVGLVVDIFIDRYKDRLSDGAKTVFAEFGKNVGNWVDREPTARTLVHGDYRLDNLMFGTPQGGAPISAVDWQTIAIAAGGRDLGYLLGNSAEPDARRRHEADALERYRLAMADLGVELAVSEIHDQYVHGTFQGPMVTMLGSIAVGQTDRGDDMFMAMAERSAAQILDLDALDVIS